MPTMNMGRQMSDEDLRRLAEILQSRGEGLASINQGEANLLSALGGSGQPLPGTQGMGVSGGPIRSYDDEVDEGDEISISVDTSLSQPDTSTVSIPDMGFPTGDGTGDGDGDGDQWVWNGINYGSQLAMEAAIRTAESEGKTKLTTKKTAPPPVKYKDQNGKEWDTQAQATDSDNKINAQKKTFKDFIKNSGVIFADDTFDTAKNRGIWDQENFKTGSNLLTDAQKKEAFEAAMAEIGEASKTQVTKFTDVVSKKLQSMSQSELEALTLDELIILAGLETVTLQRGTPTTASAVAPGTKMVQTDDGQWIEVQVEAADMLQTAGPGTYEGERSVLYPLLSETQLRGIAETMLDNAIREARFTLTPEEVAEFSRPAIQIATADNFLEWWAGKGGTEGVYKTEAEAQAAHQAAIIQDAGPVTIGDVGVLAVPGNFQEWWDSRGGETGTYGTLAEAEAAYNAELTARPQVEGMGDISFQNWMKTQTEAGITYKTPEEARDAWAMQGGVVVGDAPLAATSGNFEEWWASRGGANGDFPTEVLARAGWQQQLTKVKRIDPIAFGNWRAQQLEKGISYATEAEARAAYTAQGGVTISPVDDAAAGQVGKVDDAVRTVITKVADISDEDFQKIMSGITEAIDIVKQRYTGEVSSPAMIQLKRTMEDNVRMLLGAEVGGTADPARLRNVQNLQAQVQQEAVGQGAVLRSQEVKEAGDLLTDLYTNKSTLSLQRAMANMENERLIAIEQGKLDSARELAIMQVELQRVITQARLDTEANLGNLQARLTLAVEQGKIDETMAIFDAQAELTANVTEAGFEHQNVIQNLRAELARVLAQGQIDEGLLIADQANALNADYMQATLDNTRVIKNLESRTQIAIEQGKLDLALVMVNLQKAISIGTVNAELAMKAIGMSDALALAAYGGMQALEGVETQVDIAQMNADLQKMGFELTRDLAELEWEKKIEIQGLINAHQKYVAQKDYDKDIAAALLNLIGEGLTAYGLVAAASSDIAMKREIRAADSQVEGFLDALNAYQYKYKDPDAPGQDPGVFVGVMAQDLEKSPMGASFVQDTPHGKMVDYGHGLAAILASQSNLHDRLRNLEEN